MAAGSVTGGLGWGRLRHRRPVWFQLAVCAIVIAGTLAASSGQLGLGVLGALLFVNGAAQAPLLVLAYLGTDRAATTADRTVASTWINTAWNAGAALGASIAGVGVSSSGPAFAFGLGAGIALLASAVSLACRRHLSEPVAVESSDLAG